MEYLNVQDLPTGITNRFCTRTFMINIQHKILVERCGLVLLFTETYKSPEGSFKIQLNFAFWAFVENQVCL
jgi:acyl-ACP thioesterase